jgi:serine/threonine-protein kinase HipA
MVMGEGRNPNTNHLVKLGEELKLRKKLIGEIIVQTKSSLANWSELARKHMLQKPISISSPMLSTALSDLL